MLFILPGAIATAYAQEHEQEKKPEQKQQEAKPAQHQQKQAKPEKQPQQAKQEQQAKPEAKPQQAKQEQQAKPEAKPQQAQREQQAKPEKQPQQAAHQQQAKPAQQQRLQGQQQAASRSTQTTGSHGSIPDAKFRASFGSSHTFHVNQSQFANGSGRFQYGGFWFNAVNPWPVGWLYTDAVYVDFLNGGYFLCDPLHPGIYLSINVAI
jgi:outer membrane biosynthesis protein TonB